MASYNPPSEFLPIFDNSVFTSSDSSSGGLTLAQANALYLRKTFPDTCTELETFSAGIETTTMLATGIAQVQGVFYPNGGIQGTGSIRTNGNIFSTGGKVYGTSLETTGNGNLTLGTGNIVSVKDITASGTITGIFSGPTSGNIISNSIEPVLASDNMNIATTQTGGTLNIATGVRTSNVNIGTNATNGQMSIGSNANTQTNVYGGLVYLANDTEISGDLTISGGSIIGYLTSALASTTYATIASLSLYLTIASASATYLTITSATATYATIAQLSDYLTTVSAAATYLTITNASATYATIAQLSNYLTIASASATYATIAQLSDYLTTVSASATYLTITNASATYATIAQLANYLTIASASATYLTISNASSTYLTIANAASTYLSIASATATYLSIVDASTTYLSIVNASATYLTTATASITYATIASLSNYLTITSASATYAPKTAPSFNTSLTLTSGNVAFGTGNITTVKDITSSGNIGTSTGTITGATVSAGAFSGIGACDLGLNTGNITSCANITSSGTLACNTINTTLPANNLNICNGTNFTGEVNIATQPTATCDGIFLGNSFNPTTVNGDLTVLGTLTASGFTPGTSALNTITSVLPGDNVQLYDNQTTGTISLGGSTTRTGSISIGTNPTTTANGVFIGNSFNPTTVNGNLTVLGTLTAGSSVTTFDTLVTSTATTTADLYNNQTTGIIDLGNIAGRTGAINIGNSATQINVGNYRFTGGNIETTDNTITDYGILSNVTTGNIRIGHAQTSANIAIGNLKTSGEVNIMNSGATTGSINMGSNMGVGSVIRLITNSTSAAVEIASQIRLRRDAIDFITGVGSVMDLFNNILSGITLNIGGGGTINLGSTTSQPINIGNSGIVNIVGSEVNINSFFKFISNSLNGAFVAGSYNLLSNITTGGVFMCEGLTSGFVYIARYLSTGGSINIAYDGTGGSVNIASNSTGVNINIGSPGISTGITNLNGTVIVTKGLTGPTTPPTLYITNIGYNFNVTELNFTSITTPRTVYNPLANIIGGYNAINPGVYLVTNHTRYRYTGGPTAFSMNFRVGVVFCNVRAVVTTSNSTILTPTSQVLTRSLISGSNNNDFMYSHTQTVIVSASGYLNLFFEVQSLTVTGGSVTAGIVGNVVRIG